MIRRFLVLGFFALLSVGVSSAVKIDTKLFTETYQYDLKKLSSDLNKDIDIDSACDDLMFCQPIPNYYQLMQSDDTKIQQFISSLKKKKYQEAADLYNSQIWS